MEPFYTTKIMQVGTSKGITIPVAIMNALEWKRGDRILFTFANHDTLILKRIDDKTLRLLKARNVDADLPTIDITK